VPDHEITAAAPSNISSRHADKPLVASKAEGWSINICPHWGQNLPPMTLTTGGAASRPKATVSAISTLPATSLV
jgi:hypothetical protein